MTRKFMSFIQTKRGRLIASLILNTAFLALILLTMVPTYESNDDNALMEMVNGAKGFMDSHLVFINCVLGFFIKCLYRLSPAFPWYGMVEYAAIWAGFVALTYVILDRQPNWLGVSVSLVLLAFYGYNSYALLQFTKLASVPTCGGVFLVLHGMDQDEKPNWLYIILGTLISTAGSMYRFLQFFSVTILLSAIGVWMLLSLIGKKGAYIKRKLISYTLALTLLFGVNLSLRVFDQWVYRHDPQWSEYIEYNVARATLLDYGFPSYKEHKETYKALGIDKTAFRLYSHWNYYDPDKFTVDVMNELIALKEVKKVTPETLLDFFRDVIPRFLKYTMLRCSLLLLAFWLLLGRHTKVEILSIVYEVLLFLAMYFYLYSVGRYMVQRVDTGLLLGVAVFAAFLATTQDKAQAEKIGPGILVVNLALFIICTQFYSNTWRINMQETLTKRKNNILCLRDIAADKDHFYIGKNEKISSAFCYGPLDVRPMSELENRGYFGGWSCNVPPVLENMKKAGVTNPYRDCIDNEKVYIIDDDIDLTIKYIRKYYNKKAHEVFIREVGAYSVYKIVTD